MATITLEPDQQMFPAGATVNAYTASDFTGTGIDRPEGVPQPTAAASATVGSDGSLVFTGLSSGTAYHAGYNVTGSTWRYFHFRTPEPSDDPVVDAVKLYGLDNTGNQDVTADLNTALQDAASGEKRAVFLRGGDYLVDSGQIVIPDGVVLDAEGPDTTRILQAFWDGSNALIRATGTVPETDLTTLSVNAAFAATTLTLTSTTGIAADDFLLLGSDEAFSTENLTRYKGEIVRVASVDSATQVTLRAPIRDTYNTSGTAGVRVLTFNVGAGIKNLSVVNTEPDQHTAPAIDFNACRSFTVDNVKTVGIDSAGVGVGYSIDGTINRVHCLDHTDNSGANRYGYGIIVACATEQVVVSDCVFRKCRHGFTTDGIDGQRGAPRDIVVSGCVAVGCTDNSFDTHACTETVLFDGCRAQGGTNYGFQLRARSSQVKASVVEQCHGGVLITTDAHGSSVMGTSIRHIRSKASHGYGIRVEAPDHVLIQGNELTAIGEAGIRVNGAAVNLRIMGNTILNTGLVGSSHKSGIRVANVATTLRIVGNTIGRDTAATGEPGMTGANSMDYAVRFDGTTPAGWVFDNTVITPELGVITGQGTSLLFGRNRVVTSSLPSVASAATLTLSPNADVQNITGTTGITSVTATYAGHLVVLKFAASLTVTDGSNLKLAGDFSATADDTLSLVCDGTNWHEVARTAS